MGSERNAGKQGNKASVGNAGKAGDDEKQAAGFPRSFGANFFAPLPAKSEVTKQSIKPPVNQPSKSPLVEFATKPPPLLTPSSFSPFSSPALSPSASLSFSSPC